MIFQYKHGCIPLEAFASKNEKNINNYFDTNNLGGFPMQYEPLNLSRTDHYRMYENGTLQILSALEEDDGKYLCTADNRIGHGISKIIYLTVHGIYTFITYFAVNY